MTSAEVPCAEDSPSCCRACWCCRAEGVGMDHVRCNGGLGSDPLLVCLHPWVPDRESAGTWTPGGLDPGIPFKEALAPIPGVPAQCKSRRGLRRPRRTPPPHRGSLSPGGGRHREVTRSRGGIRI